MKAREVAEKVVTEALLKQAEKLDKKNIGIVMCPNCGYSYRGKHIHEVVFCGNCGWRRDG